MPDREERIRERAHQIWEQEGRPDGRQTGHWQRAAEEIDAEDEALEVGSVPNKAAPPAGGGLATGLQAGGTTPAGGPSAGRMGTLGGHSGAPSDGGRG
jgi:hypothetical protein